jgi:hypothetical protein
MCRVEPEALVDHLEAALARSAPSSIAALADPDALRRHNATLALATQLADRLQRADPCGGSKAPQAEDLFG